VALPGPFQQVTFVKTKEVQSIVKVKTGQTMMMGLAVLLIFFMVGCAEPADQSPRK